MGLLDGAKSWFRGKGDDIAEARPLAAERSESIARSRSSGRSRWAR
jgi:hypothetical protein